MRLFFVFAVFLSTARGQSPEVFGLEQNVGQFPPNVLFVHRSSSNLFYLTRDTMVLPNGVRMQIADVDPMVVPEGGSPSTTVYNYYQGNIPSGWRSNVHAFAAVKLTNIYPGISAAFTTSPLNFSPMTLTLNQGQIVLTVQPGANLDRFRLRVLNTGTIPFEGPGGIWFSGGRVPGVFIVSIRTTQTDGANGIPIDSSLKIESPETLSVQAPSRTRPHQLCRAGAIDHHHWWRLWPIQHHLQHAGR